MQVKDLLKKIGIDSDDSRKIKGITFNSKDVKDGYVFVAFKGINQDGNDYISEAFSKGAFCVISDRLVGYDIYKSADITRDRVILLKTFYKINGIKLIGITGTNGKTSSCHLLYQALNKLSYRATYLGTLGVIDEDYYLELSNTTPDIDVLYREIYLAKKRRCLYFVMEVSSHAISLNRIEGLQFSYLAFTNLTQDHLDYYLNMENYFMAKKRLFDLANKDTIGFINSEDVYSDRISKDFKGKVIHYGKNSEYDYQIISNDLKGIKFSVNNEILMSSLLFETSIKNLLLVYTILVNLGFETFKVKEVISRLSPIRGRGEVVYQGKFTTVVDYAHTPDAMEKIITEANKIKQNKCVVVFGCGGNRDKLKRPIMGCIASSLPDLAYITSDNPRFENPSSIIDDILKGVVDANRVNVICDRKEAIISAVNSLTSGDILLVLGKGHEDYQIIKDKKTHFVDQEVILSAIENKKI